VRKKGKWLLLLLVLLCCGGFAAYQLIWDQAYDRVPPTITMDSDELTVSVSDSEEQLLQGVTATDARDGDVTSSLVVESVRGVVANQEFTVTYAAFDRAGNVAKAQRTVHYSDYVSPKFNLTGPLLFRSGTSLDIFSVLEAEDVFDGDLTERIKATLTGGGQQISDPGDYTVEFRVTNSLGDTAYLEAPIRVVAPENSNADVALTDYLVYCSKGDKFQPKDYLKSMKAGGETVDLAQRDSDIKIDVDSNVDTSATGTYWVDYTVTYETYTGISRLIVVVED
jgi:hypothetical protein